MNHFSTYRRPVARQETCTASSLALAVLYFRPYGEQALLQDCVERVVDSEDGEVPQRGWFEFAWAWKEKRYGESVKERGQEA